MGSVLLQKIPVIALRAVRLINESDMLTTFGIELLQVFLSFKNEHEMVWKEKR